MGSEPLLATLDEIVLALKSGEGEPSDAAVLEVTVADLISDSATEIVDLSNIFEFGKALYPEASAMDTELVSVEGGEVVTIQLVGGAEPEALIGDASILYTMLPPSGSDVVPS